MRIIFLIVCYYFLLFVYHFTIIFTIILPIVLLLFFPGVTPGPNLKWAGMARQSQTFTVPAELEPPRRLAESESDSKSDSVLQAVQGHNACQVLSL
jgi:hypothetical protein